MSDALTYGEVNAYLLATLPEIVPTYEEEQTHWEEGPITPYILAMMVLNPILHEHLKREGEDGLVRRAFAAVETLMQQPEERITTFAKAGILEDFALATPALAQRAENYMGPLSRSFAQQCRAWHAAFATQRRAAEEAGLLHRRSDTR